MEVYVISVIEVIGKDVFHRVVNVWENYELAQNTKKALNACSPYLKGRKTVYYLQSVNIVKD